MFERSRCIPTVVATRCAGLLLALAFAGGLGVPGALPAAAAQPRDPAAAPGAAGPEAPPVGALPSGPWPPARPGVGRTVRTVEGVEEVRFDNGLQVLLSPDPGQARTYVNLVYRVGSRHEGNGETGSAHLLEHLLFKGTPRARNLMAEFRRRGMAYNGTTWYDRTTYFASWAENRETLDWYLDWLGDGMRNSLVARSDLDSEMSVVRNEFEIGENDPGQVLWQRIRQTAYLWHGYGRPTIGARSDIENVPIERLQAFYRTWYRPDNAVLILTGRFDRDSALARIAATLGAVPRPDEPMPVLLTREPVQDGEREVVVRRAGGSPGLGLFWHTVPAGHPDSAPLSVLAYVLGNDPAGRLYSALVDARLANSVGAGHQQLRDPSGFTIGVDLGAGGDAGKVLATIDAQIARLVSEGVAEAEVTRAKAEFAASHERAALDPTALGSRLAEASASGDWRLFFWARDARAAVAPADVQRVARTWLVPANRTVGRYLPTSAAQRAPDPGPVDVAQMLGEYRGRAAAAAGQAFEPTWENIGRATVTARLPVGLKVALLPKPARGDLIAGALRLHFGSLETLRGRAPAAQFASLLSSGTATRDRQQVSDALTAMRASLSFNGGAFGVSASFTVPREHWDAFLALLAEMLRTPSFPDGEFDTLRRGSLSSIERARADPQSVASLAIARASRPLPPDDPRYVASLEERAARWQALSAEDVRRFWRDFAGASAGEFVAVGPVDVEATRARLQQLLGDWRSPTPHVRVPDTATASGGARLVAPLEDRSNAVLLARATLPHAVERRERIAAQLAGSLLAGGSGSRVWDRVRERDGLSYSVFGNVSPNDEDALADLLLSANFAPQNLGRVESAIREELGRALCAGFTAEEVALRSRSLLEQRRLGRASDATLASILLENLRRDRDAAWSAEGEALLAAMRPEEVSAALRRVFDPSRLFVGVAGAVAPEAAGGGWPAPVCR